VGRSGNGACAGHELCVHFWGRKIKTKCTCAMSVCVCVSGLDRRPCTGLPTCSCDLKIKGKRKKTKERKIIVGHFGWGLGWSGLFE